MLTRILLAVDGSEPAGRAIVLAAEIARRFEAEVIIFHARERAMGRVAEDDAASDVSTLTDHAARWLKDEGVSARAETRSCYFGHVPREIVSLARNEGADLIVLGSRGLSGLGSVLLGGVAHKVLQLSEIPVLVVR